MSGDRPPRWHGRDPRDYQIAVLGLLLAYGLGWLDFEVSGTTALAIPSSCLLTQYVCTHRWRLKNYEPKSALISGLSLCLLLRTNSLALAVATGVFAIASKFLLRAHGRHIFNPTNFGIVAMMGLTGQVWVSPGQWGSVAFFAFLLACLGGLVINRAARSDVTYAFLAFYAALVVGRSIWLGDPMSIPLHRLQSGALLLFAFFMVSDPKTTPESRTGRILFALLVTLGAGFVQFVLFRPNGLLWSLLVCASSVPAINWLLPGTRYEWSRQASDITVNRSPKGAHHDTNETPDSLRRDPSGDHLFRPHALRILRLLRHEGGREAI